VASAARSLPAPGSLNSWHQISSPVQRLAQPALLLLVAAVGEDGRGRHAQPDRVELGVVTGRIGGGEFGVDDVLQRP